MKPIILIIAAVLATGAQATIYDFGDFKIDFPKQPKVRRVSNEEGRRNTCNTQRYPRSPGYKSSSICPWEILILWKSA